jgi:hypothetical protein
MSNLIEIRKFKDEDIPILTIPKGTVLFRYIYDKEFNFEDYAGKYIKESDSYCLGKNHNVWFFPYPYVIDANQYVKDLKNKRMVVYVITDDTKVALLIKPSEYIREDKGDPNNIFIHSCDKDLNCDNSSGYKSDPCFNEDFMKENLDVVGTMSLAKSDMILFKKKISTYIYKDFRKFITLFYDKRKFSGVPEFSIYPRKKRSLETIKTKLSNKENGFDWIVKRIEDFNYFPLFIFEHKEFEKDDLYAFLEKVFTPEGYTETESKKNYKFTIDKRTYFYQLVELSDKKTLSYCIKLSENKKLSQLQRFNRDLLFDLDISLFKKKTA